MENDIFKFINLHSTLILMLIMVLPWEFNASHEYVPASCLLSFVMFKIGPSDIILSCIVLDEDGVIGKPSLIHVYAILGGLPSAFNDITNGSFSIPMVNSAICSKTGLSVQNKIVLQLLNSNTICML